MYVKINSEKNIARQDWMEQNKLDLSGEHGIFALGYRQAQLIQALQEKLQSLAIVPGSPISQLIMGQLSRELPGDLRLGAFFTRAGQAQQEAGSMARLLTTRPKIIYAKSSLWTERYAADKKRKPTNDEAARNMEFVAYGLLEPLKAAVDECTAGVIVEPIQVGAGVIIPAYGYLKTIRKLCDEQGALLILDEAHIGLGRTGYPLACEREDILPDLFITRFIAAANNLKEVRDKGDYLFAQLQSFPRIYPAVVEAVRGSGLLIGLELTSEELVGVVLSQLSEYQISACRAQNNPWVIRFEPSLDISYPQLDYFIAALENSIKYAEKLS